MKSLHSLNPPPLCTNHCLFYTTRHGNTAGDHTRNLCLCRCDKPHYRDNQRSSNPFYPEFSRR